MSDEPTRDSDRCECGHPGPDSTHSRSSARTPGALHLVPISRAEARLLFLALEALARGAPPEAEGDEHEAGSRLMTGDLDRFTWLSHQPGGVLERLRYLSRLVGDEFLEARGDELPEEFRRSGDGTASERWDVRDAPLIGFRPHDSSRQGDDEGACTWFAATLLEEEVEALYAHWWAVLQDVFDFFAMDCIGSRETREHVASSIRIGCLGPHLSAEYDARVEAQAVVRVAMRKRLRREFGTPAREDDVYDLYDLERLRSASATGPVQPETMLGDPTGPT